LIVKINETAKNFAEILPQLGATPAIIVFLLEQRYPWEKLADAINELDKDQYIAWRGRTVAHILPLLSCDFDLLLPSSFPRLLAHLEMVDTPTLLEAAENARDIRQGAAIGTTRIAGGISARYDNRKGTEKEWLESKISSVLEVKPEELRFAHLILYEYFTKRLRMVR